MARRRLTAAQIAPYASAAGFTGDALVTAVAVALAESGGDTQARSPNGCCHGLWQIHARVHHETVTTLWDPAHNARVAKRVYDQAGSWSPWKAHTKGMHTKYLSAARAATGGAGGFIAGVGGATPTGFWDDVTGALTGAVGAGPGGFIIDGLGGAAGDALTNAAGDTASAVIAAAGLDQLPRKVLLIATAMVLLWFGGVLVALGAWRLSTGQSTPAQTLAATEGIAGAFGGVAKLAS